ncbi:hypothetical protein H5410_003539 [Solanum commersonii]|uniref:Uncharacterized protein n=1 Tax=Solanum commersonii TaxID=4109 RepID=A0A9J6B500_SOLCO|nr:hypothetical protein H5410_003539 [Solanum commersonii]
MILMCYKCVECYESNLYGFVYDSISIITPCYHLLYQNSVALDGIVSMIETRSAKRNCGIVVTHVPSQYCGSHVKMFNFANHLYLSVFVELDFLVCSLGKHGE